MGGEEEVPPAPAATAAADVPEGAPPAPAAQAEGAPPPAAANGDKPDYYFDSYSHYGIHEEMLKDEVRTYAYRDAIYHNAHMFKGKVVLDVGCGTGILSMFAARAGARRVVGVDCSSIIEQAREIVRDNGYEDVITLLHGKMEEVQMPEDCQEVDIIISEWMGYFLLYESMLNTVLWARDHLLKKDGKIFPDKATMYIAAIEDSDYRRDKIDFWQSVEGFDFRAIQRLALIEPIVDVVETQQVMSTQCALLHLDLYKCKVSDLTFTCMFTLQANRRDMLHAFTVFFDVSFGSVHQPVHMTTSPHTKYTHWKQTVFYTNEPVFCNKGDSIKGTLTCKPNERNHRDLDIGLAVTISGRYTRAQFEQDYRLR
eukprot:TRINITY_DN36020_c0_g1_i1.p1 TRINITY_DN36020_c0_g1~~TRINITY_DN36020_c0_g1_i1.p1  ORF type:complete len:369 (+),score=130.04 TRINITY_DN36020_c0_g1_i1:88-1194(+)